MPVIGVCRSLFEEALPMMLGALCSQSWDAGMRLFQVPPVLFLALRGLVWNLGEVSFL